VSEKYVLTTTFHGYFMKTTLQSNPCTAAEEFFIHSLSLPHNFHIHPEQELGARRTEATKEGENDR